jgi:pimeloyl-ACP methyl ester carboxylesterase
MADELHPIHALIHSPATGPGVWAPLAKELDAREREYVIPAIGEAAGPRAAVEAAAAEIAGRDGHVVLIGHSGGGGLLPALAEALGDQTHGLVFVDAFIPPRAGSAPIIPAEFAERLGEIAQDGKVPPVSTWFPDDEWRKTIPEDEMRAAVEAELPSPALSWFTEELPLPDRWGERFACAYLQLSPEPYKLQADEARERGWPVVALRRGGHFHMVRDPLSFGDGLEAVIRQLVVGSSAALSGRR